MAELERLDMKDEFSARKRAVISFLDGEVYYSRKIKDIPFWTGDFQ